MPVSNEFIEAVNSNNVRRVKLMMKNSFALDSSGNSFDEMLTYVQNKMPTLIDEHDGEVFKDENEWDRAYYDEQIVKIMDNFSYERLNLIRGMASKVFLVNEDKIDNMANNNITTADSGELNNLKQNKLRMKIGIAVIAVVVIIVIVIILIKNLI